MTHTFKRRQKVTVTWAAGRIEPAIIVRPDRARDGWYIVRFDDAAKLCVPAASIKTEG